MIHLQNNPPFMKFLAALAVFVVLLATAYLPKINQSGFLMDDWHSLFITENRGAGELVYHYSFDRPLRGYFALMENRLLGTNLTAYKVTALMWRLLDTVALYLILMIIWPGKWKTNVLICSLALIYPGFHEQPNAFEYQAHLFARMCMLFSILLSLVAYKSKKWLTRLFSLASAIILTQVTFGLMEYYIGIEALRAALFIAILAQQQGSRRWIQTILYNFIFIFNAGMFLVWRLFIFEEMRTSVDAGVMLSGYDFLGVKLLENLGSIGVNLYRLVVSAFYKPLVVFSQFLDWKDWFFGIGIAIFTVVLMVVITKRIVKKDDFAPSNTEKKQSLTMIIVGLAGSIGALVPIIFAGREIDYSILGDRFSYSGSISACLVVIGLIWLIKQRSVRLAAVAVLIFLSMLTQFANNTLFAKNGDQTRAVWWQMSWRAPSIESATMLGGRIYLGFLIEDWTVWSPANLIYYPNNHDITITAEVLDNETLPLFLTGTKFIAERRGIPFERDFENLLIFSKTKDACLHVIDGEHPEYSQEDDSIILEVGKLSQPVRIDVDSDYYPKPREDLFGREPEHGWCYFYQKGQLARQERDWQLTAQWGNEALEEGYSPNDSMEWLVFLQAFAYTGDKNYSRVLQSVKSDVYSYQQACSVFTSYNAEIGETDLALAHQQLLSDTCKR